MIFRALKCYWGTNWSCLQYHDQNGQTRLKIGFNLGLKKAIYVRSSAEVEVGSFFCSSNLITNHAPSTKILLSVERHNINTQELQY
jgi:hypothetical protein